MNLLFVVSFACLFIQGFSLKCYECVSSDDQFDPGCFDLFLDASYLVSCPSNAMRCKTETSNVTNVDGSPLTQIRRSCSSERISHHCSFDNDSFNCEGTCRGDGCNSGDGLYMKPDPLRCYDCVSFNGNNKECETKPLNPLMLRDCAEDEEYCTVSVIETSFFTFMPKAVTLNRECSKQLPAPRIHNRFLSFVGDACDTDNCNDFSVEPDWN